MRVIWPLLLKNWHLIVLVSIFFLVRMPRFETNFKFEVEHADDFRAFEGIWNKIQTRNFEGLNLRGQEATFKITDPNIDVPVYHGVFYYYFHIPFAYLTNFDPVKLLYVRLGFDLVSVILLFQIAQYLFNSKATALFSALFYISFYWTGVYSRYIWTPSLMPVFAIISLYGYTFRDRGRIYWMLIGLGAGAASQVQISGYWLVMYFLVLIIIDRKHITLDKVLLTCLGGLLLMWPSIMYEINSNFEMVKYVFLNLYPSGHSNTLQLSISDFGESYSRAMEGLIFGTTYFDGVWINKLLRIVTVIAFTIGGLFSVANFRKSKVLPLSILLMLPIPWIMDNYYLHIDPQGFERLNYIITPFINNLNYLLPFLALIVGWMIFLVVKNRLLLILACFMLTGIIYSNFSTTASNLYNPKSTDYNAGDKIASVKIIANDAGNNDFELRVNPVVGRNDEWVFLTKQYTGLQPESFNDQTVIGHKEFPTVLEGNMAVMTYEIIDRRYDLSKDMVDWMKVGEVGVYEIWKIYI